jgi:recombinational DNA repair ATPase RecF
MRIKRISLSWFRGAADNTILVPGSKSIVVYGQNGSGKSSFVDAVEFVLNGGRIEHLAHEYSGKHQEKGIINSHKPKERKTELQMEFHDGSELKVEIKPDGTYTSSGGEAAAMVTWDYKRTVLRQDEVAAFIRGTKGEKYSTLLPLLGLHHLEVAAENLRQLAKSVEQQANLRELRLILKEGERRQREIFGSATNEQIVKGIEELHKKYCADKTATVDPFARCTELETEINARITRFSEEQRRFLVLSEMAALDLKGKVGAVRMASIELADTVEPFIMERLEVLQSAGTYIGKIEDERDIKCPACGQLIPSEAFREHVNAEKERLQGIIEIYETRRNAIGVLCDTITILKTNMNKIDIRAWRNALEKGAFTQSFIYLDGLDTKTLLASCNKDDLNGMEEKLLPLVDEASSSSKDAPIEVTQLATDKLKAVASKAMIGARALAAEVARAEALIAFIRSLEQGIREEIRLQSKKVIGEISNDVQIMWEILHPGELVKDVQLYLPDDADKAIDIGLNFHGVDQDSPRLTLSEGYRNSLGLCIFLAMAKREADKDRPLFLDDVVISLDRNHRGMIIELLEKLFSDRQVIIFTHERDWYTELRQQLDGKSWIFKALLPYLTPKIGIRWSHKTTTFDDARAQLDDRPDAAGNDARKIMDVELALIAEKLQIKMPYLRGDKNDKRMAHDFLERIKADGEKCFQKKADDSYKIYSEAIAAFNEANRLLVSWGNVASHSFNVVRAEALKLIEACESVLNSFKCSSCVRNVWFSEAGGPEWVQCQCGDLRWRYGKA